MSGPSTTDTRTGKKYKDLDSLYNDRFNTEMESLAKTMREDPDFEEYLKTMKLDRQTFFNEAYAAAGTDLRSDESRHAALSKYEKWKSEYAKGKTRQTDDLNMLKNNLGRDSTILTGPGGVSGRTVLL